MRLLKCRLCMQVSTYIQGPLCWNMRVSEFVTSKYTAIKSKLKFGSSGFDLSVESTKEDGTVYKHQIKTSNSKMQINGADMEFNSNKNERHNTADKYQVYANGEIEMQRNGSKVFRATNSQTGMYSSIDENNNITAGERNVNINAVISSKFIAFM